MLADFGWVQIFVDLFGRNHKKNNVQCHDLPKKLEHFKWAENYFHLKNGLAFWNDGLDKSFQVRDQKFDDDWELLVDEGSAVLFNAGQIVAKANHKVLDLRTLK